MIISGWAWDVGRHPGEKVCVLFKGEVDELCVDDRHRCADARVPLLPIECCSVQLIFCFKPWLDLPWVQVCHGNDVHGLGGVSPRASTSADYLLFRRVAAHGLLPCWLYPQVFTWIVKISPEREGNFIARWGVETIAPSLLRDDRPRRML